MPTLYLTQVVPTDLPAEAEIPHKSPGPRTAEGKRRSRLNATRHSLTGQIVLFTPEECAAFEKHCTSIRESLTPQGAMEIEIAQAIAEDMWRSKRARALENSIFAQGHEDYDGPDFGQEEVNAAMAQADTWKDRAPSFNLLTIYEQRINRSIEKNTARLKELQAERKAAYENAQAKALLLTELAESKGEVYDPAPDFPATGYFGGFVYSSSEISRQLSLNRRLEEALRLKNASAPAAPRLKKVS
jgi:hypothetical protein